MNNGILYHSVLAAYMESYLERQYALGHKAEDVKYSLIFIDKYLSEIGLRSEHINKQTYEKWLASVSWQKPTTIYQRASVFRRLLLYISKLGIECYIPRLPRKHQSSTVPYIFTSNEIRAIFNACDNIMMKERQTSSCLIAIPALMRVLYSTGMRISEALSINNGDIDFERHVITLYNTKNGCQRLAPINSTLEVVLKQYIGYRNRLPYPNINADESPLFTSSIGERCKRRVIGKYFRTLLKCAGISYIGNGSGPRLHDLRHTACVHSLKKMTDNGIDAYCCLPYLSTFVGHKKSHGYRILSEADRGSLFRYCKKRVWSDILYSIRCTIGTKQQRKWTDIKTSPLNWNAFFRNTLSRNPEQVHTLYAHTGIHSFIL